MALFRRKGPEIVRKSSAEGTVEEHKTVRVKGQKVEVRLVQAPAPMGPKPDKKDKRRRKSGRQPAPSPTRTGLSTSRTRS
jgi:hypothetical protein